MRDLMVRFINEEDGDVVQNVIIIAILAALALLFGNTIIEFVNGLIERITATGTGAGQAVDSIGN